MKVDVYLQRIKDLNDIIMHLQDKGESDNDIRKLREMRTHLIDKLYEDTNGKDSSSTKA